MSLYCVVDHRLNCVVFWPFCISLNVNKGILFVYTVCMCPRIHSIKLTLLVPSLVTVMDLLHISNRMNCSKLSSLSVYGFCESLQVTWCPKKPFKSIVSWEPEGHCRCIKYMALTPFWFSADDISSVESRKGAIAV